MFDKSSWPDIASQILGMPSQLCERMPDIAARRLDAGNLVWLASPQGLPQIKVWCGWHKNTLKLGVLIPRELVWPGITLLNGSVQGSSFELNESRLGVLLEEHMVLLCCPAFMLCNDEVIRIMASWMAGRGVQHADAMDASASMWMPDAEHVAVMRTLKRKAGLFVKDVPVATVVEQARVAITRLIELAHHAITQPLDVPSTINAFMAWLRRRFFEGNFPTSHDLLRQAYHTHAVTLIEGMWRDTQPTQIANMASPVYWHGQHSHPAIKHTMMEVLCEPAWTEVRRKLLADALEIKRKILRSDNSSRRQSLSSPIATQALHMVFTFREDPALRIWFSDERAASHKSILVSTFEDISTAARPYYMAHALGDELERRGLSKILGVTPHGLLEVRDWVVADARGVASLRLDHAEFFPAMLAVWQRHAWKPEDLPAWVHQIVEARFQAGDLRVADMLSWHPECVRVLAQVCGQSAKRARWLVSWLAYHPRVVDPRLMDALFLLDEHEIARLSDEELSAIYEHLERASSEQIKANESRTTTILACAVSRLGADSFDLLDRVLKEAMSADIMTHITSTIDNLPRLSAKRRALKREQKQALEHVQGVEHFGMLSVHEEPAGLQGALSHAPDSESP